MTINKKLYIAVQLKSYIIVCTTTAGSQTKEIKTTFAKKITVHICMHATPYYRILIDVTMHAEPLKCLLIS
jgi:PIN domain nuclease of toxin-antitoxin system